MAFRNLPDMKPTNKPQFAGYGFQFEDGGSSAPVQSVNGKTGTVVLDASDVGAPTAESVTTSFNSVNGKIENINDNIAPTESTDTASQAYNVGQCFINKDGDLCCCTVDIASGGAITLNTNCILVKLGVTEAITLFDKTYNAEDNKTFADMLGEIYTAWSSIISRMEYANNLHIVYRSGNSTTRTIYRMSISGNGTFFSFGLTSSNVIIGVQRLDSHKAIDINVNISTGALTCTDISNNVYTGRARLIYDLR